MITIEDYIEPTPTLDDSKKIQAINRDTVHKICSGQVVLNLATAIKELVENSIDAGATLVEVKLKEQGSELIEVSDNGYGVEEKNFEGLTAKYHTSKLSEFSDLESIETFGFRGEALSSLCALSDMTIKTRHSTASHGIQLELDHRGVIIKQSPCARPIGTTVTLENLFSTLPVRKKEFQKNLKREFVKMCQVLQAYCLVAEGVRIICTNQNKKGERSTVLSTKGGNTILDNVTSIFGSKQTAELIPFKQPIGSKLQLTDVEDLDESLGLTQEEVDKLNLGRFKIDGFISSCQHGSGRSSRDRQFFYVNSRPCEPKQIMKIVNEMYHRYNVNQSPFVFLNLKMDRSDVDINLTPDKRQVLVNNEKILLLALKKSLLNTFGPVPSTFKHQNQSISKSKQPKQEPESENEELDDSLLTQPNPTNFSSMLSQWKATGKTDKPCSQNKPLKRKTNSEAGARNSKVQKIKNFLTEEKREEHGYKTGSDSEEEGNNTMDTDQMHQEENAVPEIDFYTPPESGSDNDTHATSYSIEFMTPEIQTKSPSKYFKIKEEKEVVKKIDCKIVDADDFVKLITEPIAPKQLSQDDDIIKKIDAEIENLKQKSRSNSEASEDFIIEILDVPHENNSRNFTMKTSLDEIKLLMEEEAKAVKDMEKNAKSKLDRLKFKAEINPSKNKAAEEELQTEISKDRFVQMDIIGQFNLGFIVVKLEDDLFIIDQHATDEKYNFEDLQKTTILQNQQLVVPQNLELTAVNELILMDNLEIFEMNGFKFEIDGSADPTKKVKLVAKPMSKNWEFGKEDIDELVFMLQDAPNTICRPSRIRSMFASRSCRKSVMIGTALSKGEMRKLVDHMGEIEQPWNCPHGRPTMRHLINLSMIDAEDE